MLVYIHGAKCIGIHAVPVIIEVNITLGIGVHLVLPIILLLYYMRILFKCLIFNGFVLAVR